MNNIPKYYWDACMWIELINRSDDDRLDRCEHVFSLAEKGDAEIWTSVFTLAEVYKKKCGQILVGLEQDQDEPFENLILSDFIKMVNVDREVGVSARRLLREYPKLGKLQDAVHVASCLLYNLDEFHTFDQKDLLILNNHIPKENGQKLKICEPPEREQKELFLTSPDDHIH